MIVWIRHICFPYVSYQVPRTCLSSRPSHQGGTGKGMPNALRETPVGSNQRWIITYMELESQRQLGSSSAENQSK